MAYVALYRQWRPQDFANLVGQDHIGVTLKNAIVAQKIAHAYLFAGPRGTGKTSTAKILAKALNCQDGPTPQPCNSCPGCSRINSGTSMDVLEIDAASNRGIDEIRELRESVKFAPVNGRYKVYIIDEVHMLTTEAFNALLKTLEEPPAHVVFILATTEAHKIPATIHSRCQRYDFRRIGNKEIEGRLQEIIQHNKLEVAPEALKLIASHADGGLRDALSILDQCTTMEDGVISAEKVRSLLGLIGHEWMWRLADAAAARDFKDMAIAVDELIVAGKDPRQLLLELALYMRSIMLYKAAPDLGSIELYGDDRQVLARHSALFSHEELMAIIQMINQGANDAKWAAEPRIVVEMTLLGVCRRSAGDDVAGLLARIEILEEKLAGGVVMTAPAPVYSGNDSGRNPAQAPAAVLASAGVAKPAVTAPPAKNEPAKVPVGQNAAAAKAQAQTAPVVPAGPPSSDLQEIWNNVIKELTAQGKRAVQACVSQGQLVGIEDQQAVVQFAAAFPKERTEKDDYREIIEKVLAQFCGKPVRLCCILGTVAVAAKSGPPKQAKPPVTTEALPANGAEHPAVRKALEMFGGKIAPKINEEA